MLLKEIFDGTLKFEIVNNDPDRVTYRFKMPDNSIVQVDYDEDRGLVGDDESHWEISFYRSNSQGKSFKYDLTKQGGATQVLGMVMVTTEDFIKKHENAKYVSFSADKGEESRVRLYGKLIQKMAKKFGFSPYELPPDKQRKNKEVFVLKRD